MSKNFNYLMKDIENGICEICSIKSVQEPPVEKKPFGEDVYKALEYALELGKKFGFETVNYDNYVGEIVWRGTEAGYSLPLYDESA